MHIRPFACGLVLLLTLMTAQGRAAVPDFQPLPADPARLMDHGSRIYKLVEGGVAEALGVRPGQVIVGIASNRVFTTNEAMLLIRITPTPFTLTLRDGQEIRTNQVQELIDQRLGVYLDASGPGVVQVLMEHYGLTPKDYMGAAVYPRQDQGLLDGILAQPEPHMPIDHPLFYCLAYFPDRASQFLLEEARRAKPDEKRIAWVRSLLRAYMALSEEQYLVAARILADNQVTEQKVDPFLDALAAFYAAIAADPPDADLGPPADGYGVSPAFANLFYPLPVRVERRYDWEPVLPTFNQAQTGRRGSVDWSLWNSVSNRVSGIEGAYLASICSAFMDDRNHGGWPIRSETVYYHEHRPALLKRYTQMIRDGDPLRVLAAYGLISPAVKERRVEEFQLAFDTLAEAGTREVAYGRWIFQLNLYFERLERSSGLPAFAAVLRKVEERLGIPALYLWLEWSDPEFEAMLESRRGPRTEAALDFRCFIFLRNNPDFLMRFWPKTGR